MPKLRYDNWVQWEQRMAAVLVLERVWVAVKDVPHGASEARVADIKAKQEPDSEESERAKALMRLYVDDAHSRAMAHQSARECWMALKEECVLQDRARVYTLKKDLHELQMTPGERMLAYLTRAEDLFTQLHMVQVDTSEQDRVYHILEGLPPAYDVRKQVLDTQCTTVAGAKEQLLKAEHSVLRSDKQLQHSVNVAARPQQQQRQQQQQGRRGGARNGKGGRGGQQQGGGVVQGTDGRVLGRTKCYRCGQRGHFQDHCPSGRSAGLSSIGGDAAGVGVVSIA